MKAYGVPNHVLNNLTVESIFWYGIQHESTDDKRFAPIRRIIRKQGRKRERRETQRFITEQINNYYNLNLV